MSDFSIINLPDNNENKEQKPETDKKPGKFKRVMHAIFVKNIGYKLLAIGLSVVLWLIYVAF